MEKLLRITNALLAVIALCLVLLVASIYRVDAVPVAQAQAQDVPQKVYLVYWSDELRVWLPVVREGGVVRTTR